MESNGEKDIKKSLSAQTQLALSVSLSLSNGLDTRDAETLYNIIIFYITYYNFQS